MLPLYVSLFLDPFVSSRGFMGLRSIGALWISESWQGSLDQCLLSLETSQSGHRLWGSSHIFLKVRRASSILWNWESIDFVNEPIVVPLANFVNKPSKP